MTARPVNPAKPSGRSGAPPSAMVEKVCRELPFDRPDRSAAHLAAVHRIIAAVLDNLPREVMARAAYQRFNAPGAWDALGKVEKADVEQEIIAAISAARGAGLGSAKGDA